jgi:dTMP kinase
VSSRGSHRGHLIALEGGEGSGKSTQAARLAGEIGAVLTREPGGTELGDRIRALLLEGDPTKISPMSELLLIGAARAEHVREVVLPALEAGRDVVSDRFSASSLAYQGYGRGLDLDLVALVSGIATNGLEPDLNVLLDVPPDVADTRLHRSLDRIEQAGEEFHTRVRDGFRRLAESDPEHWVVIDGSGPKSEVAGRVLESVCARLDLELCR